MSARKGEPGMEESPYRDLSRRQRQILDILYELGEAPAEEVRRRLPDPPSYSAARAMLGKLEDKGYAEHFERDLRYVYVPAVPKAAAQRSALSRVVRTFFGGSVSSAVTGLLDVSRDALSAEELDRLGELIDEAKRRQDAER